jgi:hypothetical protein
MREEMKYNQIIVIIAIGCMIFMGGIYELYEQDRRKNQQITLFEEQMREIQEAEDAYYKVYLLDDGNKIISTHVLQGKEFNEKNGLLRFEDGNETVIWKGSYKIEKQ